MILTLLNCSHDHFKTVIISKLLNDIHLFLGLTIHGSVVKFIRYLHKLIIRFLQVVYVLISHTECQIFFPFCIATQMWCLGRFLPLLIGHLVPEGDCFWENFLMLLTIVDYDQSQLLTKPIT